jgi:hypothetical protein
MWPASVAIFNFLCQIAIGAARIGARSSGVITRIIARPCGTKVQSLHHTSRTALCALHVYGVARIMASLIVSCAAAAWISRAGATVQRCLCAPFGTSTVAPPDKLHVVLLEPHSRLTKASSDAGLVFLDTNLTRKGCTCDTAAAVRCPTWPLAAHTHPACAAARTYRLPS